jgi:glutamine amidotransferase
VTDVAVIDSGVANLGSVLAAFARADLPVRVARAPAELAGASHVVLPGVGSARPAMARLIASGFAEVVPRLTVPVLGICLGMQLLFRSSAEDDVACLGVIDAPVERLPTLPGLRIPHMGWNRLERLADDPLLAGFPEPAYAYFVHSYAAPVGAWTLAACTHGKPFSAVVRARNFVGAQFHPERSAAVGARLLRNFVGAP